jgi:predicted CoA-binding protein
MSTIDTLIKDFLAQKRIAVAGVSQTREDAANMIYRKLRQTGYHVFAINPHATVFEGDPCYPDLKSLPEAGTPGVASTPRVDGVVIITRPAITEQIVRQCVALGVPRVWMHCSLGTHPRLGKELAASITSVSEEAVRLCRENNIAVIPGGCPMMFCKPVDFGHKCMCWSLWLTGSLAEPSEWKETIYA